MYGVKKDTSVEVVKIRKRFEGKIIELVDVGAPNLWRHLNDGDLKACDEVYEKKRGG